MVDEQEEKLEEISKEINELYEENGFNLYEDQISSYASLENLTIKIKNLEDEVLYSTDHMSGRGHMSNMHRRMMRRHGMAEGQYVEKSYPLYKIDERVGNIVIGYIDNSYLTEGALVFKSTLGRIFFISAIVALVIGILTSIFLANSLTKPLIDIRNTALEIQKGNLKAKSQVDTNTMEISELSSSINHLGETLSKQEDIRNKYASDISHELRTPISTLKSHLEAIMDGVWKASPHHLSILMNEINRLSSLVDDLKNSFNSAEHEMVLNKEKFNLSDEIKNTITTFTHILDKKGISIEKDIEENVNIYMDKNKLKQVMYNLISNSIKYTDENGKLIISLEAKGEEKAVIKVKDNGRGIKEEDLPFIFHRFYRVDASRNKDTGGSGLGLSIVKSIVNAHDGDIEVKSIYGKKTEFLITLPLED